MTSKRFVPVFIEVNKHVYSTIKSKHSVLIEVCMNLEHSTCPDLMKTAAEQIGIANQRLFNPGKFLYKCQKRMRIQKMDEFKMSLWDSSFKL